MLANRVGIVGRTVDLFVQFTDANGDPVNADSTPRVEITDADGFVRRSISGAGVGLYKQEVGLYHLTYSIPSTFADGYAEDRWVARIGGVEVSSSFSFEALTSGSIEEAEAMVFTPGEELPWDFTKEEVYGINILLRMLKPRLKNDGVRKVREGNQYIEVPCVVFTNEELICFLVNSLSSFNQIPHFTSFKFSDPVIYGEFSEVIVQGANVLALAAQALIEKGREFNITDNGINYQPPAVSDILSSQYSAQLADYKEKVKFIKCNLKPSPRGLGTYRITAVAPAYMRLRHLRARQLI